MRTFLSVAACIVLGAGLAFGQQPAFHDQLLDHLAGNWLLQGTINGKDTTHDIEAAWVLGHQYLLIHEVSRDKNTQGAAAYEAMIFIGWDQSASQYACTWLDTFGGMYDSTMGHARRENNVIHFLFESKDNVLHTTFLYHPENDSWEWQMDSEVKGVTKPVARAKLTRK
jgi:hypothetical protein